MWYRTVGCLVTLILSLLVVPLATEAQQAGKVWRISFLTLRPGEDIAKKLLLERLHELGYSEGKNLTCATTVPPKDRQSGCRRWLWSLCAPIRTC